MHLGFFIFGVEIKDRSGLRQDAEPILCEHVRCGELHQQYRLPDASFAAEQGDISQGKAIRHCPVARRRPLLGPSADIAERQLHVCGFFYAIAVLIVHFGFRTRFCMFRFALAFYWGEHRASRGSASRCLRRLVLWAARSCAALNFCSNVGAAGTTVIPY